MAVLLYILPLGSGWEPLRVTFLLLAVGLSVVSGMDYLIRAPKLLGTRS